MSATTSTPSLNSAQFEGIFRASFLSVYEVMRAINRDDHGTLFRLLQKMESWLVIETMAPRLVDSIPIVTLHDAVFCRIQDLPVVEMAFQEVFDAIGIPWV